MKEQHLFLTLLLMCCLTAPTAIGQTQVWLQATDELARSSSQPIAASAAAYPFSIVLQAEGAGLSQQRLFLILMLSGLAAIVVLLALLSKWQQRRQQRRLQQRMVEDMHDGVGASLSNIMLLAELLKPQLAPAAAEQGEAYLERISAEASRIHDTISDAIKLLSPAYQELSGLAALLGHHAQEAFRDWELDFAIALPEELKDTRLPPDCRQDFFFILKEGLHNIARHAQARAVRIEFFREQGLLCCRLQDDGCGFDPAAVTASNGLRSMARRARRIGARLVIDTRPGRGTAATLSLPLCLPWHSAAYWRARWRRLGERFGSAPPAAASAECLPEFKVEGL
jgi:signal transduction histidine kinase